MQSALALATSAGTALNDFGVPKALPALPGPYALLSNATAPGTLVAAAGAAGAGTAGAAAGAPQAMLLAAKFIGAGSRLAWGGEMCLLLGVLAAAALALPALTSLPGVGAALTWREWRLLQGWAGSAALVLATVHVLLLGLPNNGWCVGGRGASERGEARRAPSPPARAALAAQPGAVGRLCSAGRL